MLTLSKPPFVSQHFGPVTEPLCWAAALSSWQGGTPNRKMETVPVLEDRLSAAIIPKSRGALDPTKFDIVARSKNVKFAWRVIRGADFIKWDLELGLEMLGLIYLIAFPTAGDPNKDFSHARVMFSAWSAMRMAYCIDPLVNEISWGFSEIRKFKLIVGVALERAPSWEPGWVRD